MWHVALQSAVITEEPWERRQQSKRDCTGRQVFPPTAGCCRAAAVCTNLKNHAVFLFAFIYLTVEIYDVH